MNTHLGLIPIPPGTLAAANKEAIERGDLTFGDGIFVGLFVVVACALCFSAILLIPAITSIIRKRK